MCKVNALSPAPFDAVLDRVQPKADAVDERDGMQIWTHA